MALERFLNQKNLTIKIQYGIYTRNYKVSRCFQIFMSS